MNTNNVHLKESKSTVFFSAIILVFATGSVACFGSIKDKPEADIVIQINAANFHNIGFPAELFTDASYEVMRVKNVVTSLVSWDHWVSQQTQEIRDLVKYFRNRMALTLLGRMDNDPVFRDAVRQKYGQYKDDLRSLAKKLANENMARFQWWQAISGEKRIYGGFRIALRETGPFGKGARGNFSLNSGTWVQGKFEDSLAEEYVSAWTESIMGPVEVRGNALIFKPMSPTTMQLVLFGNSQMVFVRKR